MGNEARWIPSPPWVPWRHLYPGHSTDTLLVRCSSSNNNYGKVNQAARDSFRKGRGSVAQGRRSAVTQQPTGPCKCHVRVATQHVEGMANSGRGRVSVAGESVVGNGAFDHRCPAVCPGSQILVRAGDSATMVTPRSPREQCFPPDCSWADNNAPAVQCGRAGCRE